MLSIPKSKALPPLYVLEAGETCPACRQATNAYALLAAGLYDAEEEATLNFPLVLTEIGRLPPRVLALLQEHCPGWRLDQERPGQPPYLMNHCCRCGAKVTDHYLHAEPRSAFYPCSSEECWNISVFVLPWHTPVRLECSHIVGGLTGLLDLGLAKPWEALPAAG